MTHMKRKLEDLNVLDDFMFSAAASNEEVGEDFCRTILSVLLQRKLGDIQVTAQKTIMPHTPEMRGIRMDVEVKETLGDQPGLPSVNVYDLEPHRRTDENLPRHNRFYQARIDSRYMRCGERNFGELPNLFVLTITDYDPFGEDCMVYTVQNGCAEVPDLEYDDGLVFYYFNTKGKNGGSPEISAMLSYMQESTEENAVNEDIRKLHHCVKTVKIQPEVKEEFMRFEDIIAWERREAREEGFSDGKQEGFITGQSELILEALSEYGEIPDALRERICKESDFEIMKKWIRLYGKVSSIEEFLEKMDDK